MSELEEWLRFLSLSIATITIAAVPWFLGGAIPQADLVLQLGAVAAAVFAIPVLLVNRDSLTQLPLTSLPVLGMGLIGIIQLLPIYAPPVLQMEHATHFELVKDLSEGPQGSTGFVPVSSTVGSSRSIMPAETRRWVMRMVSLLLVILVVFECARTRRHLLAVTSVLMLNGCAMSVLAVSQQLNTATLVAGNEWKISNTTPFGCFVNPNNAAGWLMTSIAAALFLIGALFPQSPAAEISVSGFRISQTSGWRQGLRTFVGRVADLTIFQTLVLFAAVLLLAAVAATLSRAGISATCLGLAAFLISRSFSGRLWGATCGLLVLVFVSCSLLVLMDLDTVVLSELQTLKDPVSESTGRLLHWSDSLRSGLDFPGLGTGLGAYCFATLPYQRHYTGKWFQRADNQYVELFVEAGMAGVLCLLLMVTLSLMFVRRAILEKKHRRNSLSQSVSWLGSAVVFLATAFAGAAFFDYGISLPSVAGVILVLVVLLERYSARPESLSEAPSAGAGIRLELPRPVLLVVWAALIGCALVPIPETLAAARIYSAVVPVQRLLDRPSVEVLRSSGDEMLEQLSEALIQCPDDLKGQRVRTLLMELLFRSELTSRLAAESSLTMAQQESVFRELTPVLMADRLLDQEAAESWKASIRDEVGRALQKYPWHAASQQLMKASACMLSIGLPLAANEFLFGRTEQAQLATNYVRFSEPHRAPALFVLGSLMLKSGRIDECRKCWAQSLAASDAFCPQIVTLFSQSQGPEAALKWFAPKTYEGCVKCAIGLPAAPGMQQSLFEKASDLWDSSRPSETTGNVKARFQHLEATVSLDDAIQYLADRLLDHPSDTACRKWRAQALERAGRNAEAYDEWLRVQSFDPEDEEIELALERLVKLPPTTR